MPKFAYLGGYTAETWSRFIDSPSERKEVVERTCASIGAKLEELYFCFGEDDFLAIIDAPDDVTIGALAVGVASSGALRNTRTVKLISTNDLSAILQKAKTAAGVYTPPGTRQPAGVK